MVVATDLFHMMDPSGAPQNVNFDEPVSTFDTRYLLDNQLLPTKGNVIIGDGANWDVLGVGADTEVLLADSAQALGVKWAAGGGGAPINAQYVVLALNGVLTDERVLTGTANQIAIADGGAGGNVTLSTPQDIHAGATPEFDGLTVGDGIGQKIFDIDGGAGSYRYMIFRSGGVNRWMLRVNNVAEGGGNAGSDIEFVARADDGTHLTTPLKIWRTSGSIQLGGEDIYTVEKTDYSGISNIIGWASYTAKFIYYKKIGKTVFVDFRIEGVGDGTGISFTVPFNLKGQRMYFKPGRTQDNNTWGNGTAYGRMVGASNIVTFYKTESTGAADSWTSGNSRRIAGGFTYQAA